MEIQAAASADDLQTPHPNRTLLVPVRTVTPECVVRGERLSDDEIYAGFEEKLRAALTLLRRSFAGRLVVRNCHSGIQQRTTSHEPRRTDSPIQQLARLHGDV